MAKLIFGCGYLGRRVAGLWQAAGYEVYAVTRSAQRAAELAAAGLKPTVGDLAAAAEVTIPQGVRTVLFAVGHDRIVLGVRCADVTADGFSRLGLIEHQVIERRDSGLVRLCGHVASCLTNRWPSLEGSSVENRDRPRPPR